MEIREIRPEDDRAAISRIYEESWKYAYKDILPKSYLESIPSGSWASQIDKAGVHTLVMLENNIFIGTTSYCQSRFAAYEKFGEIISIYLLPDYMGEGYGRQLLQAAVDRLAALGYPDIFLWVLEENYRARKFYEKAGFVFGNHYLDDNIGGKALRELWYCNQARRKSDYKCEKN